MNDYSAFDGPSPSSSPSHSSVHLPILSQGQASTSTHHQHNDSTSLPGSYDFEPQIHHAPPVNHSSRPASLRSLSSQQSLHSRTPSSPSAVSPAARANAHHRRDSSSTNRILSFLTPSFLRAPVLSSAPFPPSSGSRRRTLSADDDEEDETAEEGDNLLFSHSDRDSSDDLRSSRTNSGRGSLRPTYPPSHVPLPPRPPSFAPPPSSLLSGVAQPPSSATATPNPGSRIVIGGGQGNDGVFANLAAKPDHPLANSNDFVGGNDESGGDKDEVLPAYEVAAQDTTPPYWETTVIAPGGYLGPDDICVDGLPVGNVFSFAWNLLVSMSFQFVGFLLTYLLHTSHASKNGSRAGLGITLIQLGFYLKQRVDHPELFLDSPYSNNPQPELTYPSNNPNITTSWTWWGGVVIDSPPPSAAEASSTLSALGALPTQLGGLMSGVLDASDPDSLAVNGGGMPSLVGNATSEDVVRMSAAANQWVAFALVTVGSFLLIGGVLSYWRAVRFARAVRAGMVGADAEARVESL